MQEIILDFQNGNYGGTDAEDREITTILNQVFVKEGYTDKSDADKIFTPTELRKRGKIKLARSHTGKLLGMAILVVPTSPERQVAKMDECEIHLLAVHPEAHGQGVASHLIRACENRSSFTWVFQNSIINSATNGSCSSSLSKDGYIQNPKRNWSRDGKKIYMVYEKILI